MKKTTYRVEALVRPPYWATVLTTADRDYAAATVKQFKAAKVPVRLEEVPT